MGSIPGSERSPRGGNGNLFQYYCLGNPIHGGAWQATVHLGSMVPTLNVGDRLFVTRVYNPENLERGDIVVFHSDEKDEDMIKRLIGKPGDEIVIKDGIVTVNGETLYENYIGTPDKFNGVYEVPEGKYFFLGDNRFFSSDSRYWDNPYIDSSDIMGKAQLKVYPLSDFGMIK